MGRSWVFTPLGCTFSTTLAFLLERFPHVSEPEWRARLAAGLIATEQGQVLSAQSPCLPGQRLSYFRHVEREMPVPFEATVLYQDERIVVADKPHFLPTVPSGGYVHETLLARLRVSLGIETLAPVHRIDRDTAGLVLFTTQTESRGRYHALFRDRLVRKCYEGIAPFRVDLQFPLRRESRLEPSNNFMQMHEVPGAPNAVSIIDLEEKNSRWARYKLQPITGKKHQLRVHMAALQIPLKNDGIYPTLTPKMDAMRPEGQENRLQLLAKVLSFTDPYTGRTHLFESSRQLDCLPQD